MEIKPIIDEALSPLSPKENEQLFYLAQGKTTEQIHQIIHRELSTIKTHRRGMMRKLGAYSALEALAIAVVRGIVSYEKNLLVLFFVASTTFGAIVPSEAYSGELSTSPFAPITDRSDARVRAGRTVRPLRTGRNGRRRED